MQEKKSKTNQNKQTNLGFMAKLSHLDIEAKYFSIDMIWFHKKCRNSEN